MVRECHWKACTVPALALYIWVFFKSKGTSFIDLVFIDLVSFEDRDFALQAR